MSISLDYISNYLNPENIKIPNNINLIDPAFKYTPEMLRDMFGDKSIIFVLDFAVHFHTKNGEHNMRYLLGEYGEVLALVDDSDSPVIINIDHHSIHPSFDANISTTHQALGISKELSDINYENSLIVVNHLDTDSILSILCLTNPNMPSSLKIAFAHAAIAADHSGEFSEIVLLIDSMYKLRDLNLSLYTIKEFLINGSIFSMSEWIQERYQNELEKRNVCEDIVRNRLFEDLGEGVILIKRNEGESLQTIAFPSLFEQYKIKVKVIIIATPEGEKTKLHVRSGRDFPTGMNLQRVAKDLNLQKYGYGGRANAGGNSRTIASGETISGNDFANLFINYFKALN